MQWLNQFTFVMKSSITALREKIEDPERMLHQLIIDMEEEQESVRRSVAEAIADEIQLGKQVDREREAAKEWLDRATKALKRGDETTSKAALEQKMLGEKRAEDLHAQHEKQKTQTRKLQDSVRDLEDKIRQARQKRTLLMARLARADSSRRINAALDRAGSSSAFEFIDVRIVPVHPVVGGFESLGPIDTLLQAIELSERGGAAGSVERGVDAA